MLFVSSQGGLRGESIKGRTVRERSDHRGFEMTAKALDWDGPLVNMTAVKGARLSSPEEATDKSAGASGALKTTLTRRVCTFRASEQQLVCGVHTQDRLGVALRHRHTLQRCRPTPLHASDGIDDAPERLKGQT